MRRRSEKISQSWMRCWDAIVSSSLEALVGREASLFSSVAAFSSFVCRVCCWDLLLLLLFLLLLLLLLLLWLGFGCDEVGFLELVPLFDL